MCTWGGVSGWRLKELNVDVSGPRLVVRIDVRHQRVSGAVYAFAYDAAIFLLALGMLVGDVPLEGRL